MLVDQKRRKHGDKVAGVGTQNEESSNSFQGNNRTIFCALDMTVAFKVIDN